jgi:hypothetical protein
MKYKPGTFILVPNLHHLDGKPSEMQVIYMWLCSFADSEGMCFPARTTLARISGCNIKTVDKYLLRLEEEGFITKTQRNIKGKKELMSNLYQLLLMKDRVEVAPKTVLGSTKNGATPSTENGAVTISNINYNHLTVVEEGEEMKTASRSIKEKLISDVYALWIDMAAEELGLSKKEVEKSKLLYSISSACSREEWTITDFKGLFKHFFADTAMAFDKKLSYSICLSSVYMAKYKLSKKGKVKSGASISGDLAL